MEQKFKSNDILSQDVNKVTKKTADLEEFCSMANKTIDKLVNGHYIKREEITEAMIKGLCVFDASPITEAVNAYYEQESEKIKYERARQDFLNQFVNARDEIQRIVKELEDEHEDKRLDLYTMYGIEWRLRYMTISNGAAVFDKALVISDHTGKVKNKAHRDFLNKAANLIEQIRDFNKECLRLSNNTCKGLAYLYDDYKGQVITMNEDSELFLNAEKTLNMFSDKDED